jgi:hypothetical protein
MALNLEGGPVACQGIALDGYKRDFCGNLEMAEQAGGLRLLRWPWGHYALPVVIIARHRGED